MFRQLVIMAMLLTASTPMTASAQTRMTGNLLFETCGADEDDPVQGICMGYITGVRDMIDLLLAAKVKDVPGTEVPVPCIRVGVTNGQIKSIMMKWLTDNPQVRDMSAVAHVMAALNSAFPC